MFYKQCLNKRCIEEEKPHANLFGVTNLYPLLHLQNETKTQKI